MRTTLRRNGAYILMVVPAALLFSVFFIFPVARTVAMSFTDDSSFRPETTTVGLENYARALSDDSVLGAIGHSLWYALASLVLVNMLAIPVAVALNARIPFRNGFRAIFFSPAVLSVLVVGYLWGFLLSSNEYGLINSGLALVGIPPVNWLGDPDIAMWSIILTQVWQWFGYSMVIYLANLQAINPDLYEAASIDGASGWQQFWSITLPGLFPAIQFSVVTGLISGFKVFDIVYALTGGGPGDATETVLTLLYRAFGAGTYGYAAAYGVLFLLVTLFVTMTLLALSRRIEARLS
ncbi:carbohydrate ABC transporter permease [Agromyces mangrovi Wang et al. 2018]|uniref:carbohydrate ABC transporter permease n=1 Tax=Agromyces mangrovi TaxID=1858653 RepID=UPI002572F03F|nr:sugar ABC transporter permease [Agromyces mangrovi]BDZ64429.1 sugar ABC transporter permease [Agromyces mangrovi]